MSKRDNYGRPRSEYTGRLATMTEEQLFAEMHLGMGQWERI